MTDAQCASAGIACQEGTGCTWWLQDGTACDDGAGGGTDVCVAGACVTDCQLNGKGYYECRPAGIQGGDLVIVPAGHFWMGCNEFIRSCIEDWREFEVPYHRVFLDTYGIDKTAVTLADYQACMDDNGACSALEISTGCFRAAQHPDLPAACVIWAQAQDYCAWAGKRLCTEAEWEKAARGLDGREYPWGDDMPTCELAVFDATGTCTQERWDWCGCGAGRQWSVGSKPDGDSFYGAQDVAGNVWEWVSDWRDVDYYAVSPERNPEGPAAGAFKVGRGGGYADPGIYIRSSLRGTLDPARWGVDVGFRCCKSLPDR